MLDGMHTVLPSYQFAHKVNSCLVARLLSLQSKLDVELPATLAYDYPSVSAIASYVQSILAPLPEPFSDAAQADTSALIPATVSRARRLPAAAPAVSGVSAQPSVVGIMALASRTAAGNCVFSLEGVDATRRVPFDRWAVDEQVKVRLMGPSIMLTVMI